MSFGANPANAEDAASAWRDLRDSGDIQFAPIELPEPPKPPEWLEKLAEWLKDVFGPLGEMLGMSWGGFSKVLIALAIVLVLWLLWVLLRPWIERLMDRSGAVDAEPDWAPDRDAAVALLEEADRLAAAGDYEEAVHLLLRRSVRHIEDARPDWLLPASTAREIARFPMLPERAREAFAVIAVRVERSLFALRGLDEADWQAARSAYADFALAELAA